VGVEQGRIDGALRHHRPRDTRVLCPENCLAVSDEVFLQRLARRSIPPAPRAHPAHHRPPESSLLDLSTAAFPRTLLRAGRCTTPRNAAGKFIPVAGKNRKSQLIRSGEDSARKERNKNNRATK